MSYRGRTNFRATRGQLVFTSTLSIITLAISITTVKYENELWITATCWIVFVFTLVAIADLVFSYINLGETEFTMRKNFRSHSVAKDDIESISNEKGCPVLLLLKDGGRLELPDLAARGIGNSLRAWLRAT